MQYFYHHIAFQEAEGGLGDRGKKDTRERKGSRGKKGGGREKGGWKQKAEGGSQKHASVTFTTRVGDGRR